MGLGESKVPFETDGDLQTAEKEIGICSMWDPRSPTTDFERTPVLSREKKAEIHTEDIGIVAGDPRSPSTEITRTPVGGEYEESSTDSPNNCYSELRRQLQRLAIYDCSGLNSSNENLDSDSEV